MSEKLPFFLIREGLKIKPNKGYTIKFFVPEKYFESKYATQTGSYFDIIGIFLYNVYDKNNKEQFKENKLFYYPTIFMCKPTDINKINKNDIYEDDTYRELIFEDGSEVITSTQCIQYATTAEKVLKMLIRGRIPKIIPYEKLHNVITDSAKLNGISFSNVAALEGVIISESCRSKNDLKKPFIKEYSENPKIKNTDYTIINIDMLPKLASSYSAMLSYDKVIAIAAALQNNEINDAVALERILMDDF